MKIFTSVLKENIKIREGIPFYKEVFILKAFLAAYCFLAKSGVIKTSFFRKSYTFPQTADGCEV